MVEFSQKFEDKIGLFYPITRLTDGDTKPLFYFSYETLPAPSIMKFSVGLNALAPDKKYNLRLTVTNDQDDNLVDTITTIDMTQQSTNQDNTFSDGRVSSLFTLTPPLFTVGNKPHVYTAKLELMDESSTHLDTATTWFATRIDPSYQTESTPI